MTDAETKRMLKNIKRLDLAANQKMKEKNDVERRYGHLENEDISEKIEQISEEMSRRIEEFLEKRNEIVNIIHSVPMDVKYIEIIYKKYIEYKEFEEIAVEMSFSYPYVVELHRSAINELSRKLTALFRSGNKKQRKDG